MPIALVFSGAVCGLEAAMKVEWVNGVFVFDEAFIKENSVRYPDIVLIEVIRAAEQNARARGLIVANPAAYLQKVFSTAAAKKSAKAERQTHDQDVDHRLARLRQRSIAQAESEAQAWLAPRGMDFRPEILSREEWCAMHRELFKHVVKGGRL